MSLGLRFVSWFEDGFSMVGCLPTSSMVSLRVRPVHDSVCVSGPSPATQGACPEFGCAPPDGGWYNKKRCLLRMMEPEGQAMTYYDV